MASDTITITYKFYNDEEFLGSDQIGVSAEYAKTAEASIEKLNEEYKRLYNNGLERYLYRVELFSIVGV